ncbi:hypothetical protein NESM_000646000 [Novymonas esmeraldas]|uniref:Uncharacterized protein n=1 Tax=Novymonas esmeraldas TaxID=1808958 RepID=A0AAW0EV70_9TRYP
MGAECSSEVKERPQPQPQSSPAQRHPPVTSVVPSPLVSSFNSHTSSRQRGRYTDSLTTNEDRGDRSSDETGCSGRHSFAGYVPVNKVRRWLKELPPPKVKLPLVPEPDVWSDGEREDRDWIRTEGDPIDPAGERWDAPHYVSALGLRTASEMAPQAEERKRQQKARSKARCQ